MDSPLGPTLANAFLCHYEQLWLDNCPPDVKLVVYRRYVDDIFVLLKSKDHLLSFPRYMNTRHKNLKIAHGNKGFSTSVFQATFSGVFTNFDSFILESYKTGLIFTLLFPYFTICSDMQSFHLEDD